MGSATPRRGLRVAELGPSQYGASRCHLDRGDVPAAEHDKPRRAGVSRDDTRPGSETLVGRLAPHDQVTRPARHAHGYTGRAVIPPIASAWLSPGSLMTWRLQCCAYGSSAATAWT